MTIDDIATAELPALLAILLTEMRSDADRAEVGRWRDSIATRPDGRSAAGQLALDMCRAHLASPGPPWANQPRDRNVAEPASLGERTTRSAAERRHRRTVRKQWVVLGAMIPAILALGCIGLMRTGVAVPDDLLFLGALFFTAVFGLLSWRLVLGQHRRLLAGDDD